jgi:hypothetical protein
MMLAPMATKPTPKTSTRAPKARPRRNPEPPAPEPVRADGRPKSALTLERERGALEAGQALLLTTLERNGWNLSATARDLGMAGASQVIRAIKDHALDPQYDAAKAAGKVTHATR